MTIWSVLIIGRIFNYEKSLQLQSLQQDLPLSHLRDMMHKPQNKITMDIILMTLNHTAIRIQLMHKGNYHYTWTGSGIQVN